MAESVARAPAVSEPLFDRFRGLLEPERVGGDRRMPAMSKSDLGLAPVPVPDLPSSGLEWRQWVRKQVVDLDLPRAERAVLKEFADMANGDGAAWPSVAKLAEQTRYSERHVARQLASLRRRGLLQTSRRRRSAAVRELVAEPVVKQLSFDEIVMPPAAVAPRCSLPAGAPPPTASVGQDLPWASGKTCHPGHPEVPVKQPVEVVSPVVDGRADGRAVSISDEVVATAEYVRGVLQRGIDGLTGEELPRPPSRADILGSLERHQPSREDAVGVAIEVRSIVQAHNRAPNIAALYEHRLAEHRCASQQRRRASPPAIPSEVRR